MRRVVCWLVLSLVAAGCASEPYILLPTPDQAPSLPANCFATEYFAFDAAASCFRVAGPMWVCDANGYGLQDEAQCLTDSGGAIYETTYAFGAHWFRTTHLSPACTAAQSDVVEAHAFDMCAP